MKESSQLSNQSHNTTIKRCGNYVTGMITSKRDLTNKSNEDGNVYAKTASGIVRINKAAAKETAEASLELEGCFAATKMQITCH